MDHPGKPKSEGGEERAPKIKAEDNPWYLLATLYGVPGQGDVELRNKNRVAWNRYFAADLDEETRARLIEEKRHPPEELVPYSPEEWQEVATAFAKRCKASAQEPTLLASDIINDIIIDFSNVEFECDASFKQYLFSRSFSFRCAAFLRSAEFGGATFCTSAGGPGFWSDLLRAGQLWRRDLLRRRLLQ